MPEQHINSAGLSILKRFEGCKLGGYLPTPNDVPTAGFGHTHGVVLGQIYTQIEADTWLMAEDIPDAEFIVASAVTADLNPNQFSALVCFVFNVGPGRAGEKDGFVTLKNGRPSSMLTFINNGNFALAAGEFHKWDHQAGIEIKGLTRRRQSEEELFRRPVKPLSSSRTIQAGTVAASGSAISIASQLFDARDSISSIAVEWKWGAILVATLTLVAVGFIVWARISDHLAGSH